MSPQKESFQEHVCRYEDKIDTMGEDIAVIKSWMQDQKQMWAPVKSQLIIMLINLLVTGGIFAYIIKVVKSLP